MRWKCVQFKGMVLGDVLIFLSWLELDEEIDTTLTVNTAEGTKICQQAPLKLTN